MFEKQKAQFSGKMGHMDKTTAGIVVDYDYYCANQHVQNFIVEREDKASLILLVSEPNALDPSDADPDTEPEWAVVIRNGRGDPDEEFKENAMKALATFSNVYPAISIDIFNKSIYEDAGSLIHLGGETFG